MNERFIAARERLRSQCQYIICDTPELLANHAEDGAKRLGDTVVLRRPLPIGSAQEGLDDMFAQEMLRNAPSLWDAK